MRGAACLSCLGAAVPGSLLAQTPSRPLLPNPLDGAAGIRFHYGLALSERLAIYDDAFGRSGQDGWAVVRVAVSPTGRSLLDFRLRDVALRSGLSLQLRAGASGLGPTRYYALGAAPTRGAVVAPELERSRYWIEPSITVGTPGSNLTLSAGPVFKHTVTSLEKAGIVPGFGLDGGSAHQTRPYGFGSFTQVGAQAELAMRWRALGEGPQRTLAIDLGADAYPALLDVTEPFARVRGEARGTVALPAVTNPTLQVRLAAAKLWGAVPFHEAAYLNDARLYGFSKYSLAGDMVLSAGAELRFTVGEKAIRGRAFRFGVLGLGDVGNVSYEGRSLAGWLSGFGGGAWIAPGGSDRVFSAGVVSGNQGARLYVRTGISFDED